MAKKTSPKLDNGHDPDYNRKFDFAVELADVKPELFGFEPTGHTLSKDEETDAQIAEDHITAPEKRKKLGTKIAKRERLRPLTLFLRTYIRLFGKPNNAALLIRKLRCKGLLRATYSTGEPFELSDSTVRRHLTKRFGLKGKPGRKRNK